jgi:hypothetical protein
MATEIILINAFGSDDITAPDATDVAVGAYATVEFDETALDTDEFIDALAAGAVLVDPAASGSEQSTMEELKALSRRLQIARNAAGS